MRNWRTKVAVLLAAFMGITSILVVAPQVASAASDGDVRAFYLSVVPPMVEPGGAATLHANFTNAGSTSVDPVSVEFTLPAGVTYAGGVECSVAGSAVTCPYSGPLSGNAGATVSVPVALDAGATAPVAISFAVQASGDPVPSNDSTSNLMGVVTDPTHSADVFSYAIFRTMSAPRGTLVEVDVTVGNNGPDAATDVVYVPTFSTGLTVETAPAFCTPTCAIGTVQPSTQTTFTYRFEVAVDADEALVYSTVLAAQPDPSPTNGNSSSLFLQPVAAPGRIAGTVSQGGQPVVSAQVTVYRSMDNMYVGSTTTDAAGRYLVQGLPNDTYRVYASTMMRGRWYPSAPDQMLAGIVTIDTLQPHASGVDIAFPDGRISGTIRAGISPIEGATVNVMNNTFMYVGSAVTNAAGEYSVAGLDDGTYKVMASAPGLTGLYFPGVNDSMMATPVTIDSMSPERTGIDVTFPGGTISGTVMWRDAPLANANVIANNSSFMYGASTFTDANGEFTVRGLKDGSWTLAVASGSEYYAQHPTPIVVGPATPNPSGLALVVPPGRVTGTALRANGDPIAGGSATLRSMTGQQYNGSVMGGSFAIGGVPLGTYTLSVTDMGGMGGGLTAVHPTPIEITPSTLDVGGLVLQLALPGVVTGHVNGPSGSMPYTQVTLYNSTGAYISGGSTDASGSYTFANVAPGDYYVSASYYMSGVGYTEAYHPASPTRAGGTVLTVVGGATLSNIDITLPGPATISGTVTGTDFGLVSNATVSLFSGSTPFPIATTTTNTFGVYNFGAVPAGQLLTLQVLPASGSPYLGEFYLDKSDVASATRFTLASQEARTVDFELAVGASVQGQITNAAGTPLEGWVTLFGTDNSGFQAQIVNGAYHAQAIKPGTYVVYVAPGSAYAGSDYAPEYYGESYTQAGATQITLGQGQHLTGIDIDVEVGGRIEGRVTDGLAQPVAGANIDGGSMNGPPSFFNANSQSYTSGDGTYVLRGLAPGTYDITVRPEAITGLVSTTVTRTVAIGQTLTGVDAQLQRGAVGTISIRDNNGLVINPPYYTGPIVCPAGSVFTTSFSCASGGTSVGLTSGIQQPDGEGWLVGPLAPGDYWAAAFSLSMGNQTGTQVPLTLASGEAFHCDLTMPGTTTATASCQVTAPLPAGTVRGRVTGATGTGVGGIQVTAEYDVGTNQNIALFTRVTTDALGYYTMPGVLAGSYRIKFMPEPNSPGLVQQWWTNDGTLAIAASDGDLVTVADGQTVSGIDTRLVQSATGSAVITSGGVPAPQSTGVAAAMCLAPAHYLGAFFNCSDNSPARLAFFNTTEQRYVWGTLPPGTYNVRAADVFNGPTLGAETTVSLFSADNVDCTLPLESTGTATCTVTHTIDDADGVNNVVEDAAPNAGDGNGDGTPDAVQTNVTSVSDPTIDPGTTQADYITLFVDPLANGGTSYPLAAVTVTDPPLTDPAPQGATPQTGLIGFDIVELPTTGAPVTVTLDLYLSAQANSYWKYDGVNGWRDFTALAAFDPTPVVIGGFERWRVTLTIADNGFGDEDPAQGVISDPGVFAFVNPDSTLPGIVWNGGIADGQSFDFGVVPPAPTCTATDDGSGPADCAVTGHSPAVGTHVLTAVAHDVAGNETVQTRTYTVSPYTLIGFQKPVDMDGVWNTMKRGKTVKFHFEIFRGTTELTSVAAVQSFRYTTVNCATGTALEDAVEIVSEEDDGLEYESGPGEFRLKWKTPNRVGCLKATLTTVDGSTLTALFKLK